MLWFWELILPSISLILLSALLVAIIYQILCFEDLEHDIINPYDLADRVNAIVTKEFIVQGALCALFLLSSKWFLLLISAPSTIYHIKLYIGRKHLIDVTEAFDVLKTEKQYQIVKLGFYILLFVIVTFRLVLTGARSLVGEGVGLLG